MADADEAAAVPYDNKGSGKLPSALGSNRPKVGPGMIALFISNTTLGIVGCQPKHTFQVASAAAVLEDIRRRAAISDFNVGKVKETLTASVEDGSLEEVVIHFDLDADDPHILAYTPEACAALLAAREAAERVDRPELFAGGGAAAGEGEAAGEAAGDGEEEAAGPKLHEIPEDISVIGGNLKGLADGPPEGFPGAEGTMALFLTDETLKIVGAIKDETYQAVSVEKILGDIQFRGAISDFNQGSLKSALQKTSLEEIWIYWDEDLDDPFVVCYTSKSIETLMAHRAACQEARVAQMVAENEQMQRQLEGGGAEEEEMDEELLNWKPAERLPPVLERSRPWVSLGSEPEVEALTVRPGREKLRTTLSRKRRHFNQPIKNLGDKAAQAIYQEAQPAPEVRASKDPTFNMARAELHKSCGTDVGTASQGTVTGSTVFRNQAAQWTAVELPESAAEAIVGEEPFNEFLVGAQGLLEMGLMMNEITDTVEDNFAVLGDADGSALDSTGDVEDLTELYSFVDLHLSKGKAVSGIDWVPRSKGLVATSVVNDNPFDEVVEDAGKVRTSAVLVWSFSDTIHPQFLLDAPFDVHSFRFNPTMPNIVCGGMANGQVIFWDFDLADLLAKAKARQNAKDGEEGDIPSVAHVHLSQLEFGHRQPVTDVRWLVAGDSAPHTGICSLPEDLSDHRRHQFASISADAKVMLWDIRVIKDKKKGDFFWTPLYSFSMTKPDGSGDFCGVRLSVGGVGPTTFLAVSETGELVFGDWNTPEDNMSAITAMSSMHSGRVTTLTRSPFYHDIYLTVGDWCFRIWRDGVAEPIYVSRNSPFHLSSGTWSTTRPGVLFIGGDNGSIEAWDFMDRSHEPSLVTTASSSPITSMEFHRSEGGYWVDPSFDKRFDPAAPPESRADKPWVHPVPKGQEHVMAVGDGGGVVHILNISGQLSKRLPNEQMHMAGFFEREVARIESNREARASVAAAEAAEEEAADEDGAAEEDHAEYVHDEKEEEKYQQMELEFLERFGLLEEEDSAGANMTVGVGA